MSRVPLRLAIVAVGLLSARVLGQTPSVPLEFRALYGELDTQLAEVETAIDAAWDGAKRPVAFAAELTTASSDRYADLFTLGNQAKIPVDLVRLKALGVKAVTLSVHFPLLYAPFYESQSAYEQNLETYRRVVSGIRALGLQVIIESQIVVPMSDPLGWQIQQYYWGMSLEEHIEARAQTARVIADQLKPDFLVVICEERNEAYVTGHDWLLTVEGAATLVSAVAGRARQAGVPGMLVGAGAGSWSDDYREFTHAYLSDPSVDFFNLHIYPVVRDFLQRPLEVAAIARSYGKRVAVGEAWLHKSAADETGIGISPFLFFRRNPFAFWAPLDARFLRTLVKLTHYDDYLFFSAQFSGFFYSYVPYTLETRSLTVDQMTDLAGQTANDAMMDGKYTTTAAAYMAYIK